MREREAVPRQHRHGSLLRKEGSTASTTRDRSMPIGRAASAIDDGTTEPFGFPAIGRMRVAAAFDGGRLTSDGGVMLLAAAERQLGICDRLAALIADRRDPSRVVHPVADILRARVLAIACGYEDADDLDHLRRAPASSWPVGACPTRAGTCAPRGEPA
jgi:hypothetical protein